MSSAPREHWSGRTGFILAAIGSAVGLGNMWRFSYLTAEHGGAAFVLLYLALTLLVGLPVLLAELTLGRGAGRSPIQALDHYGGPAWKPLGWLFVAAGFLILAYYSVIAGWTLRYSVVGVITGFDGDAGARFGEISTGPWAIGWHLVFMAATVAVVARGVRGGIERIALVLMPLLFIIVVGLAIYAATLEGGGAGYTYYLTADFGEIFGLEVLAQAAGQAFFSLSLGMGAILTFASYLDRSHHLPNESLVIAGSDFLVAFVAGLVVFPVLFALGLQSAVGESTVGALFITLPQAFAEMGGAGRVVGVLFFVALVAGALTSAVSLLEVVVATTMDGLGWSRRRAAISMGAAIALLGVPAALNLDVLGLMDQIAGNVFLILGGLALAIFVGWVMRDPVAEVSAGTHGVGWFFLWRGLLRFAVPVVLVVVLVASIRTTYQAIAALFTK
ncbi:MAG: sodium-dependent transporter [Myxococcota bacterium]